VEEMEIHLCSDEWERPLVLSDTPPSRGFGHGVRRLPRIKPSQVPVTNERVFLRE
jgi:hypothetical protein